MLGIAFWERLETQVLGVIRSSDSDVYKVAGDIHVVTSDVSQGRQYVSAKHRVQKKSFDGINAICGLGEGSNRKTAFIVLTELNNACRQGRPKRYCCVGIGAQVYKLKSRLLKVQVTRHTQYRRVSQ